MSDPSRPGQQALSKACRGLAEFITDVQANAPPRGPITTDDLSAWVAAANSIRAARGC